MVGMTARTGKPRGSDLPVPLGAPRVRRAHVAPVGYAWTSGLLTALAVTGRSPLGLPWWLLLLAAVITVCVAGVVLANLVLRYVVDPDLRAQALANLAPELTIPPGSRPGHGGLGGRAGGGAR